MTIYSGIFNSINGDRKYNAWWFAKYFATFIGNGVFPNPSTGLQVMADERMQVKVRPGSGWIDGYFLYSDDDYTLELDKSDGLLKRIDRIVMRLNHMTRQIEIAAKKGTFASAPVAPTLQRDGNAYELALADIFITNGATQIMQANITDNRLNKELCGIVHGLINQVDTSAIFTQYQAWFSEEKGKFEQGFVEWSNEQKNDFTTWVNNRKNALTQWTNQQEDEFESWSDIQKQDFLLWFNDVQIILDGDVAGNLYNLINNHVEDKVHLKDVHGLRLINKVLHVFDGESYAPVVKGIPLANVSGLSITTLADAKLGIKWSDPGDRIVKDDNDKNVVVAKWQGTQLRRKTGSYPIDENDGVLIADNKIKDAFKDAAFVDEGLTDGTVYYYALFPYSETKTYTVDSANRISAKASNKLPRTPPAKPTASNLKFDRVTITSDASSLVSMDKVNWFASPHMFTDLTELTPYEAYAKFAETDTHLESPLSEKLNFTTPQAVQIYGVKIDTTNSNPETAVTYTDDAVGFTPMRLQNGVINMGSWADKYPFNEIKAVVVKNGVEQYELNPNDYAKKKDGAAADITSGNDGDVFVRFSPLWWKFETIGTDLYVKMATAPVAGFKKLAHTKAGADLNYAYIGAYLGFVDGSNKLRSLSGKTVTANQTIGTFRTQAQSNGNGYTQFDYYKLLMVQVMLLIATKSRDSQTALGRGYVDGNSNYATTGGTDKKGLNFGETTGKMQNKIFGIEDFWGNYYQWIDGLFCDANFNILIGDNNFDDTGNGYVNYGKGATASVGGYIKNVQGGTETGFIVKDGTGSDTTFYSDSGALGSGRLPYFGGGLSAGSAAGAFPLVVYQAAGDAVPTIASRACFVK